MEELLTQLQVAQEELDPQFKALCGVTGALKAAIRLASDDKGSTNAQNINQAGANCG